MAFAPRPDRAAPQRRERFNGPPRRPRAQLAPKAPKWERRAPAAPSGSEGWPRPWVQLKYFSNHPAIFPAMIGAASDDAKPGALIAVYDKNGERFGAGLWNPGARVPLRMVHQGSEPVGEEHFDLLLDRALELRLDRLRLDESGDAWRVIHSDGDGVSGLVVDRFADVLSVEVHSLGVWQRLDRWLPKLHARLGTKREIRSVAPEVARVEGIGGVPESSIHAVKIREHDVRYEVNFDEGHKTGFFCDQRDNRLQLARWVKGQRVLDLCCYTGGFALSAKVAGGATDVTGVDLDEKAITQAKRNANLNNVRVDWVHCDAYSFARQMQRNNNRWPVVILDPPKFIHGRDEEEDRDGRLRYEDISGLGMQLLEPGGLLVTCSCSGLIDLHDFERLVCRAAYRIGKRLQFLDRTEAAPDHPVMSACPESRYLKVIWARVW